MTGTYQIIPVNPIFEESLRALSPVVRIAVQEARQILEVDPFIIAKKLRHPLEGRYVVRILGRRFRLVCRINTSTHHVFLDYVKPRSSAYLS